MSRYGEPTGPYGAQPGRPGDPYQSRYPAPQPPAQEPPSDPWGIPGGPAPAPGWESTPPAPGWATGQGWEQGPAPDPGRAWEADPEPAWGGASPGGQGPGWNDEPDPDWDELSEAAPPDGRNNTLLFVAVGVLLLVVAGAVGYALYLLSGDTDATTTPPPPAAPPSPAAPSGQATPDPESGQNNIGLNAAMARAGDCLTNLGTDGEPQLQIVPCDSAEDGPVYQVLAKVDAPVEGDDRAAQDASAQQACGDADGYTHHYFEVSESLSFILCMAEQEPVDPESDADDSGGEDSDPDPDNADPSY